jgi:hypothetical protein
MQTFRPTVILSLALSAPAISGQAPLDPHAALDERGAHVMGFDQKTTTHHFLLRPDGGSIEVTANDGDDVSAVGQIRSHLRHIAVMFGEGDFQAPMLVHATNLPGVAGMKAAGAAITYTFEEVALGARIRMVTASPDAKAAVHEFLRFQIRDHRTKDPLEVATGP